MAVLSVYVEKKPPFATGARALYEEITTGLGIRSVTGVRLITRYLVEGITPEEFTAVCPIVFAEPQTDILLDALPTLEGARLLAVEYLPGQFDQRADSCAQCVAFVTGGERPLVRSAKVFLLEGNISDEELARIKTSLINPIECREAALEIPASLALPSGEPADVAVLEGFTALDENGLAQTLSSLGLAMDAADLALCQKYFQEEQRDPTITEIRMLDTYWSDHCRHTTFLTCIDNVQADCALLQSAYERYLSLRVEVYGEQDRPVTLMDMATIGAKALRRRGLLTQLDESEEVNACCVNVCINVNGAPQDWLLLFKNETHNHPTEIEPYGGAATCLGGAIRDPLSGRGYVYQAMRVTGSGNPLPGGTPTLPGKLPQHKITRTAAAGYSSYGNQIGLATGLVHEIYHPGYVAKRMELGALLGAAPASNVIRERPQPGDVAILLGGRTGRDGIGGAAGSSKSHTAASLESCGAEVQKGNPPEERKIQRLFRDPAVTRLIKRCNDFGAGGVSVAIGELADSLDINLDAVPKKYEGLDGTELAISESQERMAVVVDKKDVETFIALAAAENLEATPVASVTDSGRLRMTWRGKTIVDLSREFLALNGAPKHTAIRLASPAPQPKPEAPVTQNSLCAWMADLRHCSQKGLVERFDSTVGASTVLLPFGGNYVATPAQVMAAKFPVLGGETDACSLMSFGFDPYRSSQSPYHAAMEAVVESVAKILAAGGTRNQCWLTFQEYFERLGSDPARWGKPAAALLGALEAQMQLQVASVGGKDSMSGSFEDLDVPPTLVSVAVSVTTTGRVVSGEFKAPGHPVYLLRPSHTDEGTLNFGEICSMFDQVESLTERGLLAAAWAISSGGVAEAVCKMCFGNRVGIRCTKELDMHSAIGGFVLETFAPIPELEPFLFGETIADYTIITANNEAISLNAVQAAWENTLEPVFPLKHSQSGPVEAFQTIAAQWPSPRVKAAKPRVVIPVFPGTNCEYDTASAFEKAGVQADLLVIRNLTPAMLEESALAMEKALLGAHILAIPGGFSGGDEPDGCGKFITAFFRGKRLKEAIMALLSDRDGLILGICNGFQALVKLGLIPYGEIRDVTTDSPTLAVNDIGRHQAVSVYTKVCSNKSPWLRYAQVGEQYLTPISHGEGRVAATEALVRELATNGQIATQYVDPNGHPTMDVQYNPNGSFYAIEGLTSPDGRVFGRMGHCERIRPDLYRNLPHTKDMGIFRSAADYFK